ncbi:hypothetical protein VPNG_07352 [Cytospora leucostoma]|uniref:Uncharacterized protein n=1 Tax=Cytospora leucostoma TaxID=1230097 RepID=A0A423WUQ2_9PEZI|nr:hypothetical protein VPNG_07352 [Cytospora leucostoma]
MALAHLKRADVSPGQSDLYGAKPRDYEASRQHAVHGDTLSVSTHSGFTNAA